MRGKICQAAQTNGRVKSLELQITPDLHIAGVNRRFLWEQLSDYTMKMVLKSGH